MIVPGMIVNATIGHAMIDNVITGQEEIVSPPIVRVTTAAAPGLISAAVGARRADIAISPTVAATTTVRVIRAIRGTAGDIRQGGGNPPDNRQGANRPDNRQGGGKDLAPVNRNPVRDLPEGGPDQGFADQNGDNQQQEGGGGRSAAPARSPRPWSATAKCRRASRIRKPSTPLMRAIARASLPMSAGPMMKPFAGSKTPSLKRMPLKWPRIVTVNPRTSTPAATSVKTAPVNRNSTIAIVNPKFEREPDREEDRQEDRETEREPEPEPQREPEPIQEPVAEKPASEPAEKTRRRKAAPVAKHAPKAAKAKPKAVKVAKPAKPAASAKGRKKKSPTKSARKSAAGDVMSRRHSPY